MTSLWTLLESVIPDDHSRQVSAYDLAREEMARPGAPDTVLDLGCGDAASAQVFRGVAPDVRWIGIDLFESGSARAVATEQVILYDGVRLPLATATVPLVYSRQVFEHVRYPEVVLAEIARVLRPGGVFIGSTSHLEPYHAWSLWNYTPYGFKLLVEAAGLELLQVRPGPDGIALITRTHDGRKPEHSRWFVEESPLNADIDDWGARTERRPALVNNRKLQVCGQFCFRVRKPHDWASPDVQAPPSWESVRAEGLRVAADLGHLARRRLRRSRGAQAVVRTLRSRDGGQG